MSIASEISRLQTAKIDIETAIEAKGVTVPLNTSLSDYDTYIGQIETGSVAEWTPHPDWIDISTVANNEINLLVWDTHPILALSVSAVGGYTVNWVDGVTENFATGATATHTYMAGAGQACSDGYTTFKVRIYAQIPANDITAFGANTAPSAQQHQNGILWAKIGATKIVGLTSAFSVCGAYMQCLELPASFTSCIDYSYMCNSCISLQKIVMPYSYSSSSINFGYAFNQCYVLKSIDFHEVASLTVSTFTYFANTTYALQECRLPATINGCTSYTYMFAYSGIPSLTLWDVGATYTNCGYMFSQSQIRSVVFPDSWDNRMTRLESICYFAYNVEELVLPNNVALNSSIGISTIANTCKKLRYLRFPTLTGTVPSSASQLFYNCVNLTTVDNFPALSSVTSAGNAFSACSSLVNISNLDSFGDTISGFDLTSIFNSMYALPSISFRMKITGRIVMQGPSSTSKAALNSLRLTNATSTFAGSSPQINVANCSLDTTALNLLFGDLPTLVAKTITITGNPGSATCDASIATAKGWTVTN